MDWLRRLGREPTAEAPEPGEEAPAGIERTTAGMMEFFRGVSENRPLAVLDLAGAAQSSLEVHSRFARWIRFADLVGDTSGPEGWKSVLKGLPSPTEPPYDLVLAWDILDSIPPRERPLLMERLAEITGPDARLHMVIHPSQVAAARPLRFTLVDVDRMRFEPVGLPRATWPPILPAEVERLLPPFRVVRAFTSKVGFREYVAVRGGG